MKLLKIALLASLGLFLTGCGSDSDSTSSSSDINAGNGSGSIASTRNDFGLYMYRPTNDDSGLTILLSRNGVMQVEIDNELAPEIPYNWNTFRYFKIGITDNSVDTTLNYYINHSAKEQTQVSLTVSQLGGITGDQIPFTLSIPEYNVQVDGLLTHYPFGVEKPSNMELIRTNYYGRDGDFTYLGDNTIRWTDHFCTTEAKVLDSGMSNSTINDYDLIITDSTCPFDTNSIGKIMIPESEAGQTPNVMLIAHLKENMAYFSNKF
ncbi:hypothetical protein AB4254_08140 [Vibrio breoganii]